MKKSKLKALHNAKLRKEAEERKQRKYKELMENSTVHGIKVERKKFTPLETPLPIKPHEIRNQNLNVISESRSVKYENLEPKYEGEFAERERAANIEIERKKSMVAPAYNKGAYQLITPDMNPAELGRKL